MFSTLFKPGLIQISNHSDVSLVTRKHAQKGDLILESA